MKKILLLWLIIFIQLFAHAQQVPLGAWRTHLPYNNVKALDQSDATIYCGTNGGIFTVSKSTGEINKLSTIDGLAAINVASLAYNTTTKQLMVAYENANIDLISNDKIYNLPDIFNKTGLGNKRINQIIFNNQLAYLSCGFGIVVYDLEKREVKDTYYIGSGGTNLEVYQIAIHQQNIYATTAEGVYGASLNNSLLADYRSWKKQGAEASYPGGTSPSIVSFNNFIYGVFGQNIYKYNGSNWQLSSVFGADVKLLNVSNNKLLAIADFRVITYDANENILQNIQSITNFSQANTAIINNDQTLLIGDGAKGLVSVKNGNSFSSTFPKGPNGITVKELKYQQGQIILSPGAITDVFSPAFNNNGFSVFEKELWSNFSKINLNSFAPIRDIVSATLDNTGQKKYLASYVNGLLEFSADQTLKIYNQNNSSLQTTIGDATSIRVNGVATDKKNNVWVSQYGVSKPLSVMKADGQWSAFGFPDVIPNPFAEVTGLIIDQEDNKWLSLRNDGIIVFDGSKSKKIGFLPNNGALPGSNVTTLTLDKSGAVWVGTNRGVAVFYDVQKVFSGANAEIPNVIESGFLKPLLASENINSIAVDGANRKWIGTDNGVWLFSDDGTKQVLFFNQNNSPLLSNKVLSIAIDEQTGEVFFGTANGIISYKGDATEPVTNLGKITVYPNPVRPGFNGKIGIKGLVDKASVKITDINGILVYQTTAKGGEATWDGMNFSGQETSSGVYLVLIVNGDGSDTAVSKILIVR